MHILCLWHFCLSLSVYVLKWKKTVWTEFIINLLKKKKKEKEEKEKKGEKRKKKKKKEMIGKVWKGLKRLKKFDASKSKENMKMYYLWCCYILLWLSDLHSFPIPQWSNSCFEWNVHLSIYLACSVTEAFRLLSLSGFLPLIKLYS